MNMKNKQQPLVEWEVNLQLEAFTFSVKARTKKEARDKALAKAIRKGNALIDKRNTSVEKQ